MRTGQLIAMLGAVTLLSILLVRPGPTTAQVPSGGTKAGETQKGAVRMKQQAVVVMENGAEFVIDFYPEDAPKTVENFIKLAKEGFYDGITFHRVEPGFVAQAGDPQSKTLPKGDRRLGSGGPGYTIKAEFNKQKHERGTVAMARTQDPNSAGSQFYICFKPAPFLDGQYTVFGKVTSGMDLVDAIQVGDRIKSIRIVEVPQ